MGQKTSVPDGKLLALLPLLVNWIRMNREFSDREIAAFLRQHHDHFDMANVRNIDDMLSMLAKYENHPVFREKIKIVQSPEGRKWLENFTIQAREATKKKV